MAVALIGGLGLFTTRSLISAIETERVERAQARFFAALDLRARQNEGYASLLATQPAIRARLRDNDRPGLLADLGETFAALEAYGIDNVHFHRPDITTLARLHAPAQYDDDLSTRRAMIVEVSRSGTPRRGLELGVNGLPVRAAVPVVAEGGRLLGVVDVGSFIDADFLRGFAEPGTAYTILVSAAGRLDVFAASPAARAPPLDPALLRAAFGEGTAAIGRARVEGASYVSTAVPLPGFAGQAIGAVQIDIDTTRLEDAYAMAMKLLLLGVAALGILASLAAILTTLGILRPLERLVRTTQDIAADRPVETVPLLARADELGDFARAIDQFRAGKDELRRTRDRAEGSNLALSKREQSLVALNRRLETQAAELEELSRRSLAEREAALTASRVLQEVIDTVPAVINFKDADLRYVVVNRACAEFFGLTKEEMIGRRIGDMVSGLDLQSLEATERQVLATGQASLPRDYSGTGLSGRFETWWTVKAPVRKEDGSIAGLVTVAVDLTELKEAQHVLERRTAEVEEANRLLEKQAVALERLNVEYQGEREAALEASRAKSEFLANISHELRTPLNAVIGYSEILIKQMFGPLPPRYLEYSKDILVSGQHLLEVINDILDMSRIEAGTHSLQMEEAEIEAVIRAAVKLVYFRADSKQQEVRLDVAPGIPPLWIDSRAIRQVLLNLLGNAIKFTPAGDQVGVEARRRPDGGVEIRVRDTGRGIEARHLPHVFKPFYQAEEARKRSHEGTGLGLSISRKLIELHGGTVEIASTIGVGTTVTVVLPAGCVIADGGDQVRQAD